MESAYLKGKMQFGNIEYKTDNPSNDILQDYRDSLILKNMEEVFGYVSTHAMINFVSKTIGTSRSDLLSNYETFSRIIKQFYGEVEGKKFLSKLDVKRL